MTPSLGGYRLHAPTSPVAGLGRADDLGTTRRRQIMSAAFTVISTVGLGETRLADVAHVAGISLGSVQHYFRQRDALVIETFRSLIELSGAIWQHVSRAEPDPLRRLLALLRLQVSGWAPFEQRWAFWLEFWSAARRIDALEQYVPEIYRCWHVPFEEALTEAASAGLVTLPPSLDEYSLRLTSLIDGFMIRALVDPPALASDRIETLLVETVARDLAIAAKSLRQAQRDLPAVIGIDYPDETIVAEGSIDWSPLNRED